MTGQDIEHTAPEPSHHPENGEKLYGLSDRKIDEILDLLNAGYTEQLVEEISSLSAADAAELLFKIGEDDREKLLQEHGAAFDPYSFYELPSGLRVTALEIMSPAQVAAIVSELDSDDALDLIVDLDPEFQTAIVNHLSSKLRVALEQGLSFPEDSAGRLMQREFVAIPQFWTVGKAIDYLRAAGPGLPDEFFDIFVITPTYHVVGVIPLHRIICAPRTAKLDDLKLEDIYPLPATMDQEEVARIFRREDLSSAPVVDDAERLIGVITFDDVADVIVEEAEEDLLKMGGVEESDLYQSVLATSFSRSQWLFLNLLTAFLASWVVSLFDDTITRVVALAALMPIVAGMGGNAGTQTLAVIVRGIAIQELSGANASRAVYKEALVGFFNGLIFAVITGLAIFAFFHNPILGVVIGLAMIINLVAAGGFGALVPIVLHRYGKDPAISSAIFLTTVTDCIGFFAFLGLASILL